MQKTFENWPIILLLPSELKRGRPEQIVKPNHRRTLRIHFVEYFDVWICTEWMFRLGFAALFFMLNAGVDPNEITLASALSVVSESGTLDQSRWIHDYNQRINQGYG
jgi:hypothetical protein